ncbi:hypothetical protein C1645_731851 [Glomus cerebriforme]|uniref:Uncharacterized protein n=1 Tax=Glomus cerebriforme TaxID=658196 RepID=A0A397TJP9_9GLOM|nr:hypothetical protein C1645_731851 [Glomus cerebriforme]
MYYVSQLGTTWHLISKVNEIWEQHENNTNSTEAAHAQANKEGKQLNLITAIIRGRRLDERLFKIAEIYDKCGVPYIRRDKSEIKRKAKAITRKDTRNRKQKEIYIDLEEEQKIALKERNIQIQVQEAAARKALAEAEALELANLEKKKALGLF